MASRYGWTKEDCLNKLYWEEFWEYVVTASNFTAEENNAEFRFQFMLHADKKSTENWHDLPIPFPSSKEKKIDKGGIDQIPSNLQGVIYRPDVAERR